MFNFGFTASHGTGIKISTLLAIHFALKFDFAFIKNSILSYKWTKN